MNHNYLAEFMLYFDAQNVTFQGLFREVTLACGTDISPTRSLNFSLGS